MLIQACVCLAEAQTRKGEIAALSGAMTELGIKTGPIVTRNDDERIKTDAGTIDATPAWRFSLDLPETV
jgi:hypothetical protein